MPRHSQRDHLELLAVAVLSVAVPVGCLLLRPTGVVGLYHDDGIYLSAAKSLVERGEYRLIDVPSEPYETKYPPLYSSMLALVWRMDPHFPENIRALKAVNSALLVVINLLSWLLIRRLGTPHLWARIFGVFCIATCPVLFAMSDVLISDPLMTLAMLGVVLSAPDSGKDWSTRQVVVAAVCGAAAALTRAVGVTALVAMAFSLSWRRDWPRLALGCAIGAVLLGPWLWWRFVHQAQVPELLRYYVAYERNAFDWMIHDPIFSARILGVNLLIFLFGMGLALGISNAVVGALVLASAALACKVRRWPAVTAPMVSLYVLAICAHPFPLLRYLAPLAPLAYAACATGVGLLAEAIQRLIGRRGALAGAACAAVVILPLSYEHTVGVARYVRLPPELLHVELGLPSAVRLPPFVETVNWLRAHASANDRIAARHDPYYFLYTGLQGVRPWIPRPETYLQLYGLPPGEPLSSEVVNADLDRLGVTLVIVDQGLGGGENVFVSRQLNALLDGPSNNWRLVFQTSDGLHRVYRKAW